MSSTSRPVGADELTEEVLDLERRRCQALTDADLETLRAMTSPDYVHIHATGRIETREEYLESLSSSPPREAKRGDTAVRTRGNVAILTGPYQATIRPGGAPPREISGIATSLWAHADAGWRIVCFQVTTLLEQR